MNDYYERNNYNGNEKLNKYLKGYNEMNCE